MDGSGYQRRHMSGGGSAALAGTPTSPSSSTSTSSNSLARPLRSPPNLPALSPPYRHQTSREINRDGGDSQTSPSSPSPSAGSSSSESHDLNESAATLRGHSRRSSGGGGGGGKNRSGSADEVPLLGGERIEAVFKDMTYLCPYSSPGSYKGTMTITNYKLYFKSTEASIGRKEHQMLIDVPLGFISRIEKVGGQRTSSGENAYGIEIYCKDIRTLRFALSKSDGHPRKDIFDTLRMFSFPVSNNCPIFAYQFTERYPEYCNGWKIFDALAEYKRMGLPNESWRLTRINDKYEFCETYPKLLAVPALVSDEDLREVAKYRSRSRIPVLCWVHPDSMATICRSAQPLVGVRNNRSESDERYIQQIMNANAQSHRIFIMDARPKVNALANIATGGGYENENLYENVELVFLDIHNIHVMRESLRKVKDICFPIIDDAKWLSNVDSTQWLYHLHCILTGAVKIADKVENGKTSVLVHCSDGWDRTAQLTALSMLLLDPYYRTLTGFQVLIEKEWLSFGHKFMHRIGHGEDKHNDNDRSPVFLQFIDCVWQVTNQCPYSFEFNESFLVFILDHLYACLFGTFLYNCDKERKQNGIAQYTQSLWSFVNYKKDMFLNPLYNGGAIVRGSDGVSRPTASAAALFPSTTVRHMRLWTGYYCRWNPRMRPQDSVRTRQTQMLAIKDQLRTKMDALRKELESKRRSTLPDNNELHLSKYEPVNI